MSEEQEADKNDGMWMYETDTLIRCTMSLLSQQKCQRDFPNSSHKIPGSLWMTLNTSFLYFKYSDVRA